MGDNKLNKIILNCQKEVRPFREYKLKQLKL